MGAELRTDRLSGGALLSGGLSDRFGRKWLLFLSAVLFAVSSVGTGMAGSFDPFVTWRIIGGVAIGLASNLSPMYISEISPSAMRGRLVSLNQFTIVIGVLLAQVVNLGGAAVPGWIGGVTAAGGCWHGMRRADGAGCLALRPCHRCCSC